ncbi:MAG: ATP-binding cassette domain-containing protein, partial [Gallicola sp.]|nr:ATP-binding cassette domain-containing protein [Gallicola sp.]
ISFRINPYEKVGFIGNELSITTLFQILSGEMEADSGTVKWGKTVTLSYFPKDNAKYFEGNKMNLMEWLRQYSKDPMETYLRGFLGRMLFSGDNVYKKVDVLSGGEKVRMMLSRMMLKDANTIILDQPTSHLDLESIVAVNNGLIAFKGNIFFSTHDTQFMDSVANRIIHIEGDIFENHLMTYHDYIAKFIEEK